MSKISKSLYIFFIYWITITFIYNCRSVWSATEYSITLNRYIYISLLLSILILIFLFNGKYDKKKFLSLILMEIFLIFYLSIYGLILGFSKTLIESGILILILIFLLGNDKGEFIALEILKKYSNVISIIALISLLFWIFGSILGILQPSGTIIYYWGNRNGTPISSYHNLYFETQNFVTSSDTLSFLIGIKRNTSIFTEAPMASLNFSLALAFNEYNQKNLKWYKFRRLILIVSILSTLSTTGYIFLILYLLYKFLTTSNSMINKYKKVVIPIAVIILGYLVFTIFNQKINFDTGSSSIRRDDYIVGFNVWLQHPIFGVGIANSNALIQAMGNWRIYNTGFSNSIMEILSQGGLYLSLGYFFCFVRAIFLSMKYKDIKKLYLTLMLCYLFIFTIFTYTYILLFLLVFFVLNINTLNYQVKCNNY